MLIGARRYGKSDGSGLGQGGAHRLLAIVAHPGARVGEHPAAGRWLPIGKWLVIEQRPEGLWVEGELTPGVALAEEIAAGIKHGTIDGLSVAYDQIKSVRRGATVVCTMADLREISIVDVPADGRARLTSVKGASGAEELPAVMALELQKLVTAMRAVRVA